MLFNRSSRSFLNDGHRDPPICRRGHRGGPLQSRGLQYTPMGFPVDLIDIPVFPREIWGRLVKETRAAVARRDPRERISMRIDLMCLFREGWRHWRPIVLLFSLPEDDASQEHD
jgi:hypothetical protein